MTIENFKSFEVETQGKKDWEIDSHLYSGANS